ncbi:MAG: FAD-binding oxidoreductase [Nitratireductor sp.]|uniref:NAD(P)/FAD-dependent oxidoreductase n=1 Tax=Nitratireductor sp. TaxID=1872084 RepID=UPI0026121CEB|nr:FAD-binding oxidoreductase [Nitratireductor sp.]MCV0349020.1 FAD-binding oxidoreductase [Nitratireductor sp.]
MSAPDVLIIGAGITGAVAALELTEMGAKVEVVDRYGPAAMASGWTLAGVRQSGRHPAELPLALDAVARWQDLDRRLEARTSYRQEGNLRLARSEAEVDTVKALVEDQKAAGLDISFLADGGAVREIVPALSPAVLAASWCSTDGHADPVATVNAYLRLAKRQGAEISTGEGVRHLQVSGTRATGVVTGTRTISAGAVLAAPGVLTNTLLEPLGLAIPLRRPLVTVLRSSPCSSMLAPVLGVANADMAVRQEVSGHLRATSGAETWRGTLDETDGLPVARTSMGRIMETIARVSHVLPGFAGAEIESVWGGVLDLTPDALPVIDHVPGVDNLVIAAGFSGHGFGIGPTTGALAAQLVMAMPPNLDVSAFRFERFLNRKPGQQAALTLHG